MINPFGQQIQEGAFVSFGPGVLTAQILNANGSIKAFRQFSISNTSTLLNGIPLFNQPQLINNGVEVQSLSLGMDALELSIPPQTGNLSGVALNETQFKYTLLANEITEDENGNFNIDYTNA